MDASTIKSILDLGLGAAALIAVVVLWRTLVGMNNQYVSLLERYHEVVKEQALNFAALARDLEEREEKKG